MKSETIDLLKCVATTQKEEVNGEKQRVCQGMLAQLDDLTLVCQQCNAQYPIHEGIPLALPASAPQSMYLDEELIQQYYEMHFGPYLTMPQTSKGQTGRVSFPGFDQVRSERETVAPNQPAFTRQLLTYSATRVYPKNFISTCWISPVS